jgi:Arc-like DNA binding domain
MVGEGESKIGAIPPFALRMQRALRTRVEAAADANRRSVNSEIVARLAQSFGLAVPGEVEPGEVLASPTAKDALALARSNEARIKTIEDALRVVCDDAYIDHLRDEKVQKIFLDLGTLLHGP